MLYWFFNFNYPQTHTSRMIIAICRWLQNDREKKTNHGIQRPDEPRKKFYTNEIHLKLCWETRENFWWVYV